MKGDFSRSTFEVNKHFSRVLLQQGRVQLDADWNEQVAILLHYLRTLAADLIGDFGGPAANQGFAIGTNGARSFTIGNGRYYVGGLLCENENDEPLLTYATQPDYPLTELTELRTGNYLAYLEVWERHVTAVEDSGIREVALGGVDTAARARVVWQVKTTRQMPDGADIPGTVDQDDINENWDGWLERWQPTNRGQLKADAATAAREDTDPCLVSPHARYRRAENQLYRVEIHNGRYDANGNEQTPTFKWSRENGSVLFPIRALQGRVVTLEHLGRDGRFSLQPGDWVEIADNDYTNLGQATPLLQVQSVDRVALRVTLTDDPAAGYGSDVDKQPLLRRWEGYGAIEESGQRWTNLEDGVRIQFQPLAGARPQYRSGDYWLIPARTATGDVEWPEEEDSDGLRQPKAQSPQGERFYAPLGIVFVAADGAVTLGDDCRCVFTPLPCLT